MISLIGQLRNKQKMYYHNLIQTPYAQVLYAVSILIIYFIVFEILTIISSIGQLSN